jgi:hypothetical protein
MRLDILIVSYNRPENLTLLVQSLGHQHSGDYTLGEIHLMQDGPNARRVNSDKENIARNIEIFEHAFPQGHVHAAPHNIGIVGNYTAVVNHMKNTQADAVIVFEDDLELSPHYLNVMTRLLRYAQTSTQVGMVSAKGLLGATAEQQNLRQRALLPMGAAWSIHRWGWGMTRDVMSEYVPILEMYLDFAYRIGFLDNGDTEVRKNLFPSLQRFINQLGFYQTTDGVEIDTMYDLAAYVLGRVNLCTYANFLRSTGETGTHYDDELFAESNLRDTVLLDTPPDDFAWFEPDMMLHVLTLIRRYFASIRLNYNSGTFGCQIPFSGLHPPDLIRSLYESIYGWPFTEQDIIAHKYRNYSTDPIVWSEVNPGLLRTVRPIERHYSFPYAV